MYDCPKCGKKNSSFDGSTFCGPCESKYRQDQRDWAEQEREILRKLRASHADDCDCPLCRPHSGIEVSLYV